MTFDQDLQHFSDTLTIVHLCCVARDIRFQRSVDRNSFRSPRAAHDRGGGYRWNVQFV